MCSITGSPFTSEKDFDSGCWHAENVLYTNLFFAQIQQISTEKEDEACTFGVLDQAENKPRLQLVRANQTL